jgi:hypothetical protein
MSCLALRFEVSPTLPVIASVAMTGSSTVENEA